MANLSTYWKIDGNPIYAPDPNSLVEKISLTNEIVTDDGVTHIDWIRTEKTKVSIKYSILTNAEISTLVSMVQGKEFTLTYKDPVTGASDTINCYCKGSTQQLFTGAYLGGVWMNVTIECYEK